MKFASVAALVLFFVVPATVSAESVLRAGNDVSVQSEQNIEGNYYVSAFTGQTVMSGSVNGDMIALAGSATINGSIEEDLHLLGGVAQVHGDIGEDVRVVGGEVTIGGVVGGDVLVLGGKLNILSTAEIAGDVFFFGGVAEINGSVDGHIYGNAEQFIINSSVGRSVDVRSVLGMRLGADASVAEDVRYTSAVELNRDPNSSVEGSVVQNPVEPHTSQDTMRILLTPFLILLFTTLSLFLIFRSEVESLVTTTVQGLIASGFVGLAVVVLAPVLSIILMATVLGLLVGTAALFTSIVVIITGAAFTPVVVGALLARFFTNELHISLPWILIASVSLYCLLLIPFIGFVIYVAFVCISIGGVTLALYRTVS